MAIEANKYKALTDKRWSGSFHARSCRFARNENRVQSATTYLAASLSPLVGAALFFPEPCSGKTQCYSTAYLPRLAQNKQTTRHRHHKFVNMPL